MLKANPLPSGWRSVPLRDAARIVSGGTPSRTRADFWTGLLPWASAKDLKTFRLLDTEEHVSREGAADGSRIVPKGSVLILVRGMTLMKDVPIALTECDMALNQDLRALLPKDGVHAEFLGYALASQKHALMGLVDQAGHGTGRLSTEQLEAFRIMVPDSIEQRAIARVLRQYDKAATVCGTLLKARRKLKRGLMQQLLTGQRRFPEYRTRTWRQVAIGEVLQEINQPIELQPETKYRLVSIRRRSGGFFDRDVRSGADIGYPSLERLAAGDFVIARRQVLHGAMAIVPPEFDGAYVSNAYAILRPRDATVLHLPFFNYLSQQQSLYHMAFRCSYGVAIEKMFFRLDWFFRERLLIPPTVAEQQQIVSVFETADAEIDRLRQLLHALKEQKKGLMQKLLTGVVRVPASMLKEATHA